MDRENPSKTRWDALADAYKAFMNKLCSTRTGDWVTVNTFHSSAQKVLDGEASQVRSQSITRTSGGTCFRPALQLAKQQIDAQDDMYTPVLIFMSDGGNGDGLPSEMKETRDLKNLCETRNLKVHTIFFGMDGGMSQMKDMAGAFGDAGEFHLNVNQVQLMETFENDLIPVELKSMR